MIDRYGGLSAVVLGPLRIEYEGGHPKQACLSADMDKKEK